MKKFLNFVGQGVDPAGAFLHDMRRAETAAALSPSATAIFSPTRPGRSPPEPYPGVWAQPNREAPRSKSCSIFDCATRESNQSRI